VSRRDRRDLESRFSGHGQEQFAFEGLGPAIYG